MKKHLHLYLLLALLFTGSYSLVAQNTDSTTTIILVRHAEKDTIGGEDPELSVAGQARAQKLQGTLKEHLPDNFYSTPYKRTRQTLQPWADKSGKEIVIYNPQNMEAFAQVLLKMKGKTVVVAGHSNTVPTLVNLLSGAAKYQSLNDSVYNKIFIVTVKGSAVSDRVVEY